MGVAIWTKIWKVFGNCLGGVLSTCFDPRISGVKKNTVDFWSLDVEGQEANVLQNTDFSKVEVSCWESVVCGVQCGGRGWSHLVMCSSVAGHVVISVLCSAG